MEVGWAASEKAERQEGMGVPVGSGGLPWLLGGDRTEGNGGLCVLTGYVYAALCRHWRGTETWPCSGH